MKFSSSKAFRLGKMIRCLEITWWAAPCHWCANFGRIGRINRVGWLPDENFLAWGTCSICGDGGSRLAWWVGYGTWSLLKFPLGLSLSIWARARPPNRLAARPSDYGPKACQNLGWPTFFRANFYSWKLLLLPSGLKARAENRSPNTSEWQRSLQISYHHFVLVNTISSILMIWLLLDQIE